MSRRAFIVLITIIVVMGAFLMSNRQEISVNDSPPLFPGLEQELNNVTRLTIKAAGNRTVATLNRGAERWSVAERNDYPADVSKIRANLISLAEATVVEEKTAAPALYSRLGVEDIANENATGVELIIDGANRSDRVIIGKTGVRGDQAYARLPESAVSLLIASRLELADDTAGWLDHAILDIPSSDIFRVTITHPDGESIEIKKAEAQAGSFKLVNLPADAELAYATVVDSIGSVLAGLTLDDVTTRADVNLDGITPVVTRFETFGGLIITASVYMNEKQNFVGFEFTDDADLTARFAGTDQTETADDTTTATAIELNTRLSDWLFVLPSQKQDELTRHISDLLKS